MQTTPSRRTQFLELKKSCIRTAIFQSTSEKLFSVKDLYDKPKLIGISAQGKVNRNKECSLMFL